MKARRKIQSIETPWGVIRFKVAETGRGIVNVTPEYDDCKRLAVEKNVPLKEILEFVRTMATESLVDKRKQILE